MQTGIPYMHFRGGSSKGLFFLAKDLPAGEAARNRVLLAAMEGSGLGDPRQIDGLGGGGPLSSKVAIVSRSETEGADLDYFFVQVVPGKGRVATGQTCGNILAAVLPFAIESGLIAAADPVTRAVINIVNTGGLCEVIVETPGAKVNYAGNARVDGVMGTAAPILCNYLGTEGATCGALFPSGNPVDVIEGKEVTCIDNGMPVVLMRAADFGISGYERKEALDAHEALKSQLEKIRLQAGLLMNLGDVREQPVPKVCLISPPQQEGGVVNTRMFIPHVCHDAIGVLAAISVATACIMPHTVAEGSARIPEDGQHLSVEHPSGEMTVILSTEKHDGALAVRSSGVMRTARLISKGEVFIPAV